MRLFSFRCNYVTLILSLVSYALCTSGRQRPVISPKRSKKLNEAVLQLPMVRMLAQNRGEHQPNLQLETNVMKMYPNPLSLRKSTRKFYPMNSQKHGVALIINNKKLSEGSTYEMADCDEVNLTETLMFLGYHVWIYKACSHDAMKTLFERIDRLDPVMKSGGIDSFICCILSRGDEEMVYGVDNKPVGLREIQERVKNCKVFKKLPKMFFIQAYLGKRLDPTKYLVLSKHSGFYFSYAATSSEQPFRDPNKGSSYVTELCKALCTHSTDMVLSDILKNVGVILKAKWDGHSQLVKEDSQLKKEVYFFHGKAHTVYVKAIHTILLNCCQVAMCNDYNYTMYIQRGVDLLWSVWSCTHQLLVHPVHTSVYCCMHATTCAVSHVS